MTVINKAKQTFCRNWSKQTDKAGSHNVKKPLQVLFPDRKSNDASLNGLPYVMMLSKKSCFRDTDTVFCDLQHNLFKKWKYNMTEAHVILHPRPQCPARLQIFLELKLQGRSKTN